MSTASDAAVDRTAVEAAGPRFADPAPLGLAAFALTTFVLSLANVGAVPLAADAVLGLALFYGGAAQFAAGIWEFANRNTFGATAFCTYGAFWMAFWFLVVSGGFAKDGAADGWFLFAFGIFTLYMAIAALRTNVATFLVFAFLTLTFFALAIGALAGSAALGTLGGVLGIITALLAWYTSFAGVLSFTFKRSVLPVFPLA
jgi:uncharacterized protein